MSSTSCYLLYIYLRSYAEIYPKEMELKPENQSIESGSYLDLDLKIDKKSLQQQALSQTRCLSIFSCPYAPSSEQHAI